MPIRIDIALACALGILAIVMYLITKTPTTVIVLLVIAFALSFYIVWTFPFIKKSIFRRLGGLLFVAICLCIFGYYVWPIKQEQIPPPQPPKTLKKVQEPAKKITVPLKHEKKLNKIDSPKTITPPQQNFNVTSNDQKGGITAGIVNVIPKPQPRNLSEEQQKELIEALKPFSQSPIEIETIVTSDEVTRFANQVIVAIKSAGLSPITGRIMSSSESIENIQIRIHDATEVPLLANTFLNFFKENNFAVKGYQDKSIKSNSVVLLIGPISND